MHVQSVTGIEKSGLAAKIFVGPRALWQFCKQGVCRNLCRNPLQQNCQKNILKIYSLGNNSDAIVWTSRRLAKSDTVTCLRRGSISCTTSSSSWTCNVCKSVTVSDFASLRDVQTIASLLFPREYIFRMFFWQFCCRGFLHRLRQTPCLQNCHKALGPTNIFAARPDFSIPVTLWTCMWLPQLQMFSDPFSLFLSF
jgi:hypothetical protein